MAPAEGFTDFFGPTVQSVNVQCDGPEGCPTNIGIVLSAHPGQPSTTGFCNGFLFSGSVLVTNGHCVPKDLQVSGASCAGRIRTQFFDKSGRVVEELQCRKVLAVNSTKERGKPDFAYLEVESTTRSPLPVSKSGLVDGSLVKSLKFTPLADRETGLSARLDTEVCKVTIGSILNHFAATPWSYTGVALGCSSVEGNSGAPLLNSEGAVIGILHGSAKPVFSEKLYARYPELKSKFPDPPPVHGQFTNMACILPTSAENPNCRSDPGISIFEILNRSVDTGVQQQKNVARFNLWLSSLPKAFAYQLLSSQKTNAIFATPECVKDSGSLGVEPKTEKVEIRLESPLLFQSFYDLDAEFRVRLAPPSKENQPQSRVVLARNAAIWSGTLQTVTTDEFGNFVTPIEVPLSLPVCSAVRKVTPDQITLVPQ
jgi:hypothetical protein